MALPEPKPASQPPKPRANGGRTISGGISDLPLDDWREYDDIFTDSLWVLGDRDNSGAHDGFYHGNFIPQIPHQLMRRYTKTGGVVLDGFLGSGTTMIEAKRLGRNSIGVELLPEMGAVAKKAFAAESAPNGGGVFGEVIVGDSRAAQTRESIDAALAKHNRSGVDLIVLHPPYHDIVKFSENPNDLCNASSVREFTTWFGDVIENLSGLLAHRHYLAVVIGDKYTDSEWVPLGFRLMDETLNRPCGLALKSILVKNMVNNRAKRNKEHLWRYRAFTGGFYIFRHEYILLFQKRGKK